MKQHGRILTLLAVLAFAAAVPVAGQSPQQPTEAPEPQQNAGNWDPIRELNLTPDQRQQIRTIRENNKVERAEIGERLRQANEALNAAMNADNPDEDMVEQRVRDVSAAQAAVMRMRMLTEVRIWRVLTPQQRDRLRVMQRQARQARQLERERLQTLPGERQRRREIRGLNQRNALGPLAPRRENKRQP